MIPLILCIPDTKDSFQFLEAAQREGLPLLLLIKKKWRASVQAFPWDPLMIDDLKNLDALIQKIDNWIAVKHPRGKICDCIAFGEANIELIGCLNSHYQTGGMDREIALSFRDKLLMKNKAALIGISTPIYASFQERAKFYRSLEENHRGGKAEGFLIKPRSAWGCQGIERFIDPLEAEKWLASTNNPEKLIFEEYLDADMFHVGGLVVNGKTELSVVIKHGASLFEMGRSASEHMILYTIDQSSKRAERLREAHDQIVKGFGYENGLTFIEFFEDRTTKEILLCEAAARHPALGVPMLTELITGKNIFKEYAKALSSRLLDRNEKTPTRFNGHFAGIVSFAALPGKLIAFTPLDRFDDDEIVFKSQPQNLLHTLFPTISFKNTLGQMFIKTKSEESCIEKLTHYCREFQYETMPL